ncbi:MAG: anti-sigma factor RsiW [Gammaproteobacteria bacterium]|jgi:anti-sigma factor RsiW
MKAEGCLSIRNDLDAYRDGVLDENRNQVVRHHVKQCENCKQLEMTLNAFEQTLKHSSEEWHPSRNLWQKIDDSVQQKNGNFPTLKWHSLKYFTQTAAALILCAVLSTLIMTQNESALNPETVSITLVNEFHTFVISHRELDYRGEKPNQIRQWFADKVDFRTPIPVITREMKLSGGRLCNILDQRIVSYMYLDEGSWVSLYIFSDPFDRAKAVIGERLVNGYGYIDWQAGGLHFALIGDVSVNRLRVLAKILQQPSQLEITAELPPSILIVDYHALSGNRV